VGVGLNCVGFGSYKRRCSVTRQRTVIALALLAGGCQPQPVPLPDDPPAQRTPPVEAVLLSTRGGKPPLRFYDVRLTVENRRDRPVWVLLQYFADRPLPASGEFVDEGLHAVPFEARQYAGAGGKAVEVTMHGGAGFRALRLPAGGRVVFERFEVKAWREVSRLEVWEASELRVNGRAPLERWLPYGTLCGKEVSVPASAMGRWENLDWDAERCQGRQDYPKEKVGKVTATVITRWTVRLRKEKP
jgi:hypothetical protein